MRKLRLNEEKLLSLLVGFMGFLFLFGSVFGHGGFFEDGGRVVFGFTAVLFIGFAPTIWIFGGNNK